ncbi:MAG: ArsA family ATPase, partial [Acidobacteriota bacterium]
GADIREVLPGLHAVELDAEAEAARYLELVRRQVATLFSPAVMREVSRQFELAASMPGVVDVALFDRMTDLILATTTDIDLLIFDTAPTGHTLRLLQMPESLGVWVGALASRRREMLLRQHALTGQAPPDVPTVDPVLAALERREGRLRELRTVLTAADLTSVVLVLQPERLPIEETARALASLEQAGLPIGGLVVNRVLPGDLEGTFYDARRTQERQYLNEIDRRFAGRIRAVVPQFESDVHGLESLARVAEYLLAGGVRSWDVGSISHPKA